MQVFYAKIKGEDMRTTKAPATLAALREILRMRVTETKPDAYSPYAINGNPPMWFIARKPDGTHLAARPAKAQERRPNGRVEEIDGVSYQYVGADGAWIAQGMTGDWKYLADEIEKVVAQGGELIIGPEPATEPATEPDI
jgi:hypothetical protein